MTRFLRLRGSFGWWFFLLFWFALPWVITYGLYQYGEYVPQSVRYSTVDLVAFYSFLVCAIGGMVLIFLPKKLHLPRVLIVFLAVFSLVIATFWPHYLCGPEFVQSKKEQQHQASSKVEQLDASAPVKKAVESCS